MKKIGTLNTHLSRVLAGMGHTDRLVVCDCGLPIPRGKEVVDLALAPGLPGFLDVLRVILDELEVEEAVAAEELAAQPHGVGGGIRRLLPGVELRAVPHEAFKQLCHEPAVVAFVRTGEATPYANVMLASGVTFG